MFRQIWIWTGMVCREARYKKKRVKSLSSHGFLLSSGDRSGMGSGLALRAPSDRGAPGGS
jgi:hypothetical protein